MNSDEDRYFSLTIYQTKSDALLFSTDYLIDIESRETNRYNQQIFYASKVKQLIKMYFGQEISEYQVGEKTLVMRRYEDIIVFMTDHKSVPAEVIHKQADFFYRVFTLLIPASKIYPMTYVNVMANFVGYYNALLSHIRSFRMILLDNPAYFLNAHEIIVNNKKVNVMNVQRVMDDKGKFKPLDRSYYILFAYDKIILKQQPQGEPPLDDTDVQILLGYVLSEYGGYQSKANILYINTNKDEETSTTAHSTYDSYCGANMGTNMSNEEPYQFQNAFTFSSNGAMSDDEEKAERSIQSNKSSYSNTMVQSIGQNRTISESKLTCKDDRNELSNDIGSTPKSPRMYSSKEMSSQSKEPSISMSWQMYLHLGDKYPRPCCVTFIQIETSVIQIWITPKKTPKAIMEPSQVRPFTKEELKDHRKIVENYRDYKMRNSEVRSAFGFYNIMGMTTTNILSYVNDVPGLIHVIMVNRTTGETFTPEISGYPIIPFVGDLKKGTIINAGESQQSEEQIEIEEIKVSLKRDIFQLMMRACQSMSKGFTGFMERGPLYTRIHTLTILEYGNGETNLKDLQISSEELRELGLDNYRQSIVGSNDFYRKIIKQRQENKSLQQKNNDKNKKTECLIEVYALFLSIVSFPDAQFMLDNFITKYASQVLNLE